MEIKGLNFVLTCSACPEQYDVFDKDSNIVGYVRLRHGYLYAEYPDVGGELVYNAYPNGDGMFQNDKERQYHLNAIANKLVERIERGRSLIEEEEEK